MLTDKLAQRVPHTVQGGGGAGAQETGEEGGVRVADEGDRDHRMIRQRPQDDINRWDL